jgi:hypothetical protein
MGVYWRVVERQWFRAHGSLLATIAAWIAVRLLQWISGAIYSDGFLDGGWQLVPRETLRHHLFGSVWYLHIQPPLYNLTIGILLRAPLSDRVVTHIFILACSLMSAIGLHRLGVLFDFSGSVAAVLATVLLADPFMIRYELEPTYEIPVLALLVWALILLHRAAARPSIGRYAGATALVTVIVLTRSLFHPIWLIIVLAALVAMAKPWPGWRPIATAAAIPIVLIGGWMIKNEIVFHDATLSSWFGMNLERGVIAPMDADKVGAMVAKGQLPEIVTVPPFTNYDVYAPFVDPCTPAHAQPAVSQPLRPSGYADFNFECYLPVYAAMYDASLDAIRHQPLEYLRNRVDAFKFSSDHLLDAGYGKGSLRVIRPLYRIAFLDVRSDVDLAAWFHPLFGPGKVIVYPSLIVVVAAILCCWEFGRGVRRMVRRSASPAELVLAVSPFTVLWVIVTGALLEMGENARFRAMVHPLLILVALAAAKRLLTAARVRSADPARSG